MLVPRFLTLGSLSVRTDLVTSIEVKTTNEGHSVVVNFQSCKNATSLVFKEVATLREAEYWRDRLIAAVEWRFVTFRLIRRFRLFLVRKLRLPFN